MRVEIERVRQLRFDDGTPVRAASAVARFGDGVLVVQDDATHAAWCRPGSTTRVRVLPAVEGHDTFSSAEGTKHLKPDLEAACEVSYDGNPAVLLLGSGSSPARMRASLVRKDRPPLVADLTAVYAEVARVIGLPADALNLEGACQVGDRLRWFSRGNARAGVPSASVDVGLAALLHAVAGGGTASVSVASPRHYRLGGLDGVDLEVTDAVALPDGRILVSAAAEDTPNMVDDGPVVATALALLDDADVLDVVRLPEVHGLVHKVEALALRQLTRSGVGLLTLVDADDPGAPSTQLDLWLRWGQDRQPVGRV